MGQTRTVAPRTAVAIIGAVVVGVVLLALVLSGDDGDGGDLADLAVDVPTTEPILRDEPAEPDVARPEIPPLPCERLLTQDDIDDALAVWERDPLPGSFRLEEGETCTEQFADDESYFVRIQPGAPGDFAETARLLGVPGEPVEGVGDGAVWFDGDQPGGEEGVGALSVHQSTPVGVLLFRVVLGRPDVDAAARLEILTDLALSALPRFPEVEVEQPEPTVVTFERDAVDRSDLGFVDHLLAKEEAGEWTRGEGLVAMLGLFAGEVEESEVLGGDDVVSRSGTDLIALAREYVDSGPDESARDEVARLLDELLLSGEELAAIAASLASDDELALAGSAVRAASRVVPSAVAQGDLGCPGEEWFGLGCWAERSSVPLDDAYGVGAYRVFHPDTAAGDVYGWSSRHVELAVEAMRASVFRYWELGSSWLGMPNVEMMITPFDTADAFSDTASVASDNICFVYLVTPMQSLSDEHFQQRVAIEIATCLVARTFPRLSGTWDFALPIYLSGLVYPDANAEHEDLPRILAGRELATTLYDLRSTNWIFFEYLDPKIGPQGIFETVNALPPLADRPGIAEEFHRFRETLTNAAVPDLGRDPRLVPYEPEAWEVSVNGPIGVVDEVQGFGVSRVQVMVTPGDRACVSYEPYGDLRTTWREGAPGEAGAWTEELPTELTGGSVFVTTTIEDAAEFSMKVTRVVDEDDECEEEEDPGAEPIDPSCLLELLCGPSGYYVLNFEMS